MLLFLTCHPSRTQNVIKKAQSYFRIQSSADDFILVTEIDGEKLEVTDDLLRRLHEQATVDLVMIAESEEPMDEPKAGGVEANAPGSTFSNINHVVPQLPPVPPSPLESVDT